MMISNGKFCNLIIPLIDKTDFRLDWASVMLIDFSTWRYTYQVANCTKREQTLLFDTGSSVATCIFPISKLPRIVKTDRVLYNLGTQRSGSGADGNSLKPVGPPGAWDNPFPSDIRDTFFFLQYKRQSTTVWINSFVTSRIYIKNISTYPQIEIIVRQNVRDIDRFVFQRLVLVIMKSTIIGLRVY